MPRHLLREIDEVKRQILSLSAIVEESVRLAVQAIETRDSRLAAEVVARDGEIDRLEMEVEEACLKILALYQPVAIDLRFIVSVLKINNDLERVGDLAVNIAERAAYLSGRPEIGIPFDFGEICRCALEMLRQSLDALMSMDSELAYGVFACDDRVDAINREMYGRITAAIHRDPQKTDILLSYLTATRRLERVADYATNIAEDVIYMVEGQIVRHRGLSAEKEKPIPGGQGE
ncbi:MAG: phosphate signaling complex protein PhoU [Candidatus Eisenbacteria bacterium]|uniref:Phosphate-specific transport system accessory protein PhoU n=1 Tax=Eiseniibacteriota bacterium TaxID=2212470 RepID=A0A937XCH8_UNCEI|nr:phosphate signaling complex protein PhoU [Candidatus Eisenbacteria bacterium]